MCIRDRDDCRFCNQLGGTAVILLWYYIRSNYNCAGILVWIPGLTDEEKRTCNCNHCACLLYTSDAADEEDSVDLGGRRIIEKKKKKTIIHITEPTRHLSKRSKT